MKPNVNSRPKSCGTARRIIWPFLVALTLCGISLVFLRRPPLLLDRASVALEFEQQYDWEHIALNDGVPIVATLSDTKWLVGDLGGSEAFVARYKMDQMEFNPSRRFAVTNLAPILNQKGALVGDIESSPDGHWVLGTLVTTLSPWSPARRIVVYTDGSQVMQWPAKLPKYPNTNSSRGVAGSYVAWMPDSQSVAEIVAGQSPSGAFWLHGTLHDVYSRHTSTFQFSAPGMPEHSAQLAIRPDVLLLSSISKYDRTWTSPIRNLLQIDTRGEIVKPTVVDLYTWNLLQSGALPYISHLKTPENTWLISLAFSPNGKRLAWEVVREIPSSTIELLFYRMLRRPTPAPSAQIEVWTSDREGSGMKMIGCLPRTESWDYDSIGTCLHLDWLPSGKGLRFAYSENLAKGKIYIVKFD